LWIVEVSSVIEVGSICLTSFAY